MITLRKAEDRGHFDFGWLNTYHTFSFSQYYDPQYTQFRTLRVINEDRVQGGQGFGTHPHRDMEIISYVLEGALEHRDSMGNGSVIRPGDVQRMTAGSGITHSEYNHSKTEGVHFLQIWITPVERNLEPGYEQKNFTTEDKRGKLRLIASPDGRDGSVTIHQDTQVYAAVLDANEELTQPLQSGRHAWVQVLRGKALVNGKLLETSDGASLSNEQVISLAAKAPDTEVLLFDLA